MKTNKRELYLAPQCLILQVSETTYLMDTSFPSQHRPAIHRTGPAAQAKNSGLWDDDLLEDANNEWSDN